MANPIDDPVSRKAVERVHDVLRRHLNEKLPDVSANHDIVEYHGGGIVLTNKKTGEKFHVESPSPGWFYWNGSNAMTEEQLAEKIKRELKA